MKPRRDTRLAQETAQTLAAVPWVMAMRLTRLAIPGAPGNQREAAGMVTEKWLASIAAAQAMTVQLWMQPWQIAQAFWTASLAGVPGSAAQRHALERAVAPLLTGDAVLRAGLAPVRKKVLANQRRLSGGSRKRRRT